MGWRRFSRTALEPWTLGMTADNNGRKGGGKAGNTFRPARPHDGQKGGAFKGGRPPQGGRRPPRPQGIEARAEHVALHVRALLPLELAEALDVGDGLPPDVASDRAMARVVVAALWTDKGPAFASEDEAARMPQREWSRLMDAGLRGLCGVMPSRALCDVSEWEEWRKVLDKGARHPSNAVESFRMRDCVDLVAGHYAIARPPRPDRYFGMPIADITEGQQLAFDAARAAADDIRQKANASREPA